MRKYLLFQLYGPLCSWGDVTVGEIRTTSAHPSKSAVLGILAAALGVSRTEERAQRALADSYAFAVRVDSDPVLARDYHTVQMPKGKGHESASTRRDELGYARDNTMQTYREYLGDALYTVVLWSPTDSPSVSLAVIQQSLEKPTFVPYLGRKSCPPTLPFEPRLIEAETLRQALEQVAFSSGPLIEHGLQINSHPLVHWESDEESGLTPLTSVERRDFPSSRARWQFDLRQEYSGRYERSTDSED